MPSLLREIIISKKASKLRHYPISVALFENYSFEFQNPTSIAKSFSSAFRWTDSISPTARPIC